METCDLFYSENTHQLGNGYGEITACHPLTIEPKTDAEWINLAECWGKYLE